MTSTARPWKDTTMAGLFVFLVSIIVYRVTAETTVAFWDCGEFIAAAALLQVPHAPGAPLYLIIARIFTVFTSDVSQVAMAVTSVAIVSSSITVGVLCSVIMKLIHRWSKDRLVILTGGLIGAFVFAFSDSFWTSATEAEVYNMSNLLVVLIIWSALKFIESEIATRYRFLLLISFLVGCSMGVHLLSLLTLPAAALIIFYKNGKPLMNIATAGFGLLATLTVQYFVIPAPMILSESLELKLVNDFGLSFFSGVFVVYILLLAGFFLLSLVMRKRTFIQLISLSVFFVFLGSGIHTVTLLRAGAGVPMNEGAPDDSYSLRAYLARAQFGQAPLLHGPQYTAEILIEDGKPVFEDGKREMLGYAEEGYITVSDNRMSEPVYDPEHSVVFPRMYSSRPEHVRAYQRWANIPDSLDGPPSFAQNIRFFVRHQIGHSFFRYVLWNFSGRQNNFQGMGGPINGNWITGIDYIDRKRGVDSSTVSLSLADPRARAPFFAIPLVLGLIGIFAHFAKDGRGSNAVLALFFMTGIALVLYLNQTPMQARERDYAYVGAFLSFSIWIGIGASFIIEKLKAVLGKSGILLGLVVCLMAPILMLANGWDLHNKSNRNIVRESAFNYLKSCRKNTILFTQGDNDTYPVWYLQQVEGVRRDVRVVNLSLLNTDWYLEQMRKAQFEAPPIKFSIGRKHYRGNRLLYLPVVDEEQRQMSVSEMLGLVVSKEDSTRYQGSYEMKDRLPTTKLLLPMQDDTLSWNLNRSYLLKSDLAVVDIIGANFPSRPIAFASSCGRSARLGLGKYLRRVGMIYELGTDPGSSDVDVSNAMANADFLINECQLEAFAKTSRIHDEEAIRLAWSYRNEMAQTCKTLLTNGDTAKAVELNNYSLLAIPVENHPIDHLGIEMAEIYLDAGSTTKGLALLKLILGQKLDQLEVIIQLETNVQLVVQNELENILSQVEGLFLVAKTHSLMHNLNEEEFRFKELGKVFLES